MVRSYPERDQSARSVAVTQGSFLASAHWDMSAALVQSQGHVYCCCTMLLTKDAGRQVLDGGDAPFLD
jgi:hypothetical protein